MKKRGLIYSILSVCVLLSFACKTQLPEDVPNNLEIRYVDLRNDRIYPNGPPSGFFKQITVSGNQLTIEMSRCQKVENITLDEREIRGLYRSFVKSEFDLIENGQSSKSDSSEEGFKEIHLRAGNVSKSIKQGKEFPLSKKNDQRFNGLWTTVVDRVYPKMTPC